MPWTNALHYTTPCSITSYLNYINGVTYIPLIRKNMFFCLTAVFLREKMRNCSSRIQWTTPPPLFFLKGLTTMGSARNDPPEGIPKLLTLGRELAVQLRLRRPLTDGLEKLLCKTSIGGKEPTGTHCRKIKMMVLAELRCFCKSE